MMGDMVEKDDTVMLCCSRVYTAKQARTNIARTICIRALLNALALVHEFQESNAAKDRT